jgi:hypothetical protein
MTEHKVILTDVDGVVLAWEYAFECWVKEHGYEKSVEKHHKNTYDIAVNYQCEPDEIMALIRQFNESAAMGFIPPHRDAMYYIKLLHEKHGYVFHAITSMSENKYAQELRIQNLKKLFGTAFVDFQFLDTGAPKDEILKPYAGAGYPWVEDKVSNAEIGYELGLDSYIMEHGFNMNYEGPCKLVKNWAEIYNYVTGE